jgi:hypothetical protein
MKKTNKNLLHSYVLLLIAVLFLGACKEEAYNDETFSSDDFRILKVSEVKPNSKNTLEQREAGISANNLNLELVLSHPVVESAIEGAISFSDPAGYEVTYDESKSIMNLQFQTLAYETEYTLSIPEGSYGVEGAVLQQPFSLSFSTSPFIIPVVTLSAEILGVEEGNKLVVKANLSELTTEPVTVNLTFAGEALIDEDYSVDNKQIVIPINETSAAIEISFLDDVVPEGAESIEVSIESVVNGQVDDQEVPLSLNIIDNDVFTDLTLKGVLALDWSTAPSGNSGKAVHLRAKADISDLSIYSIGVANNGGGTDSIEYTFPAMAVSAGEDILLAREDAAIGEYFGGCISDFEHIIQTDAMNQNGDDAIELYSGTAVIETFGDVHVDATGMPWEYSGSWAYNFGDEWVYGGVDCAVSSTSIQTSNCVYPMCANELQFQGIMSFETDPTGSGSTDRERAIHLRANQDIADLSVFGIGIANNGGGSDGREMDLPAISVSEGDHILFIRDDDVETISTYFGNCINEFDHLADDGGINFNGDDGVELYKGADVVEVYGDVVDDGTGLFWEYTGSWAFKQFGDTWTYAGVNCSEFAVTNATSDCVYLFCE